MAGARAVRGWAGARRALLCLGLAAAVSRALLLGGPPRNYDEGVYWSALHAMSAGHPLYASVFDSQPPLFLLLLHPVAAGLGGGIVAARLGVMVLSLGGVAAAYVAGRALAGTGAGLGAALVLAADPLAISAGVSLQAEGPSLALALVAVALAADSRQRSGRRATAEAFMAGEMAALAVMTKLLAVSVLVPVVLLLGMPVAGSESVRRRALPGLAGLAIGLGAVLLPFATTLAPFGDQVLGMHVAARSVSGDDLSGPLLRGLPLAVVAAAGLLVARRRAPTLALVGATWLAAAAVVLLVQRPVFEHHLVSLVPPLALAAGPALAAAWTSVTAPSRRHRLATGAVAVAAALAVMLSTVSSRATDGDDATVAALRGATMPTAVVIGDDQFAIVAAGRGVVPELVDTSSVRIASGSLTTAEVEDLAVRDNVDAFLLATGRLASLPGLVGWVARSYPRAVQIGPGTVLYLRR